MDNELEKLKDFLLLVDSYLIKLKKYKNLSYIINMLDDEIFIYNFEKCVNDSDLKNYCISIKNDEDIENNYFALSYAYSKYYNSMSSGNKKIDEYILKMIKK